MKGHYASHLPLRTYCHLLKHHGDFVQAQMLRFLNFWNSPVTSVVQYFMHVVQLVFIMSCVCWAELEKYELKQHNYWLSQLDSIKSICLKFNSSWFILRVNWNIGDYSVRSYVVVVLVFQTGWPWHEILSRHWFYTFWEDLRVPHDPQVAFSGRFFNRKVALNTKYAVGTKQLLGTRQHKARHRRK